MTVLTGLLNINKPQWMTSRDVVNRVVRVLRQATGKKSKVGHCGTLDPLATGVLVVCVGQATRLVSLIQELPKTYRGRFLLGRVTDTDDITGQTRQESPVAAETFSRDDIEALLPEFTGRIEQVPPQFSAVHVDGKRAYELARRGADVKLEPRAVDVYRLALESFACPDLELLIECGSGTYVRSIGRDIGQRLGCGATMSSLVRSAIGPFTVEHAIDIDELSEQNLAACLLPASAGVQHLSSLHIRPDDAAVIRNGREIPFQAADIREPTLSGIGCDVAESLTVLIDDDGELVAISKPGRGEGTLTPKIVFNRAE